MKKQQVKTMFNQIAHRYDLMNRVMTAGLDLLWRKKAVLLLRPIQPKTLLDVATGTGDFIIAAAKHLKTLQSITAIDIAETMLKKAKEKLAKHPLAIPVQLLQEDAEQLPFADNSFDAITVGFGVRNFEHLEQGLKELYRVLRKGGRVVILEPGEPSQPIIKNLFQWYFHRFLPTLGGWISGHKEAYAYLPASVAQFPKPQKFLHLCKQIGYQNPHYFRWSFGACLCYVLEK